jgi:anti-sigma B factor antagonist
MLATRIAADAVVFEGCLDVTTAPDARLALHSAIDSGAGPLVLDLSRVETLDASGLGVLVGAHRRAVRSGRTLLLRNVPPHVMRLLWVTRLQRVLHVEPVHTRPATIVLPQESLAAS